MQNNQGPKPRKTQRRNLKKRKIERNIRNEKTEKEIRKKIFKNKKTN